MQKIDSEKLNFSNTAVQHFNKSTSIDGSNKESQFGLLIAEGRILVKKGNKNGIWDAIEKFSKASSLYPENGEPFYWMAKSYTKLGDTVCVLFSVRPSPKTYYRYGFFCSS